MWFVGFIYPELTLKEGNEKKKFVTTKKKYLKHNTTPPPKKNPQPNINNPPLKKPIDFEFFEPNINVDVKYSPR